MNEPRHANPNRPVTHQFTLRGMFLVTTATSVILAVLALIIREPVHWLGALAVPLICLAIIAALESARTFRAPDSEYGGHHHPVTRDPLDAAQVSAGESPFAPGNSPFAPHGDSHGSPLGTRPPAASTEIDEADPTK